MNRSFPTGAAVLAAGLLLGVGAGEAVAQVPVGGPGGVPQYRPTFSPYLNLLRRGSSPTLNYYGLVRPELNFLKSINQLNQQAANDHQAINDLQSGNQPTTGHPVQFLNTGNYFQSLRGAAGTPIGLTGQGRGALSADAIGGAVPPPRGARR